MAKLMLFICIALLVGSAISASTYGRSNAGAAASNNCGRHGDACTSDSQCCGTIRCHRYANRCQVQITADELMAQREKILGRRGKDY